MIQVVAAKGDREVGDLGTWLGSCHTRQSAISQWYSTRGWGLTPSVPRGLFLQHLVAWQTGNWLINNHSNRKMLKCQQAVQQRERELSPGGSVLRSANPQLFPELNFVCLAVYLFIVVVFVVVLVFILFCYTVMFHQGLPAHTRDFQSHCLFLPSARITGLSLHCCLLHICRVKSEWQQRPHLALTFWKVSLLHDLFPSATLLLFNKCLL